jgi:hypothetical protein
MTFIDFMKYWLDTHPLMFGLVIILLVLGITNKSKK